MCVLLCAQVGLDYLLAPVEAQAEAQENVLRPDDHISIKSCGSFKVSVFRPLRSFEVAFVISTL